MPILNHNDLKKVEEYQTFVRTSPYANATQDLAWEKVKEGWVGEQVYLEENGKIIAAMSLIIRRVFAGFSLKCGISSSKEGSSSFKIML